MSVGRAGVLDEPVARPGTLLRIIGPVHVNGMPTWRVWSVGAGGVAREPLTPPLLSYQEAKERSDDLAKGKKTIWMGPTPFKMRPPGDR